jgi:AcrR family transcriptional regulator
MAAVNTRKNKRIEQGDRSKEEILDAAMRIMAAKGYDGTSISVLAKECGLPASSIYWHFSSKAGVLHAVMEREGARFLSSTAPDKLAPAQGGASSSRIGRMTRVFEQAVAAIREHPEFLRILFLLTLSAPADGVNEAVARLRVDGKDQLRESIRFVYSDLRPEQASIVADELIDLALATFDGVFISAQNSTVIPQTLIVKVARSLTSLGDEIAAEL